MIIPFGHDRTVGRVPYLTIAVIAICTLVQLYSAFVAPSLDDVRRMLDQATSLEELRGLAAGIDPDAIPILKYGYRSDSGLDANLLASAFVHDGWLHLIGNMLFLWLAGSAVEDRLGRIAFAVVYLAGAAVSAYGWAALHTGEPALLVGASGAVSVLMGAFLLYFASTRIWLWYWVAFRTGTFQVPAYVVLPLWLVEQVLYESLQGQDGISNIGYTAHIVGFGAGFAIALAVKLVFGGGDPASEPDGPAVDVEHAERAARLDAQYRACMDAIAARDASTVRTTASRVLLDLRRAGDPLRMVQLYQAIAKRLDQLPLTDGAFLAVAKAAEQLGDDRTYVTVLEAALHAHPTSRLAPELRQRLARVRPEAPVEP